MDDILFEDFKKLDIRVGEVLDVAEVEGADKLYLVTVDVGTETRKFVAGIKPWYTREDLLGKRVIVLLNLTPKIIRGVESHGMILATRHEGGVTVLTTEKIVPPGSPVS